jgi:hypothetical protein
MVKKAYKDVTNKFFNLKNEKPNEKEKDMQQNPFDKNDYIINEKLLLGSYKPISLEQNEKINSQLRNTICNIIFENSERGTGFFTQIKFPGNNKHLLPVLITCNHVIDKLILFKTDNLKIQIYNTIQIIELKNRIIYTNKEQDITIIEIKEKDKIQNFLTLDEENQDFRMSCETVYILQYLEPYGPFVSYGTLKDVNKKDFSHSCNTNSGSSGSPILYLNNNKVIGIHKGTSYINNYNLGKFLNNSINDFIKKVNENKITEIVFKCLKNQPMKKIYIFSNKVIFGI